MALFPICLEINYCDKFVDMGGGKGTKLGEMPGSSTLHLSWTAWNYNLNFPGFIRYFETLLLSFQNFCHFPNPFRTSW